MTDQAKQGADGWIEYDGSGMPCDGQTIVDVRFKYGDEHLKSRACFWRWDAITHWRPHKEPAALAPVKLSGDEKGESDRASAVAAAPSETPVTDALVVELSRAGSDAFEKAKRDGLSEFDCLKACSEARFSAFKTLALRTRDLERRLRAAESTIKTYKAELHVECEATEAAERERDEARAQVETLRNDVIALQVGIEGARNRRDEFMNELAELKAAMESARGELPPIQGIYKGLVDMDIYTEMHAAATAAIASRDVRIAELETALGSPLGRSDKNGVVWAGKNPHAFEEGWVFYAARASTGEGENG